MYGVNGYGAYQSNIYDSTVKSRNNYIKTGTSGKSNSTNNNIDQPELSDKAQALLEKLKKKYGNMDLMVADFSGDEDAKSILSHGTKEYSVLFSTEELEKMASDQKYEKEYTNKIDDAVKMSKQINRKYGFGPDSEKGEITKFGVSFNSDGTTSYFAELEKMSDKQRERIEKAKEQNKDLNNIPVKSKRTRVTASSMKELVEAMDKVDWSKIKEEEHNNNGDKFDFSI